MNDNKLVRAIGRWDLTALTINTIIGAGIFGLPSKAAALIGSHSIYAIAICAVIVGLIVLCYAEVSSRFEATGGPYLYAKVALGPIVGFEVGWLYWIVRVATFAANCNLFVIYLGFLFPATTVGLTRIGIIGIVVSGLAAVNLIGVRQSSRLTNIFTVGKLVPLALFCAVGLAFIKPENFSFTVVPDYASFSSAILLFIYAFVGFEAAAITAGETKNPQRNLPFALITALALVAILYVLIQIVSVGTLSNLANSERPLADAAAQFAGFPGAVIMTAAALVSILGNLNVGLLSATRLIYAMADQNELPKSIGLLHPRFRTPYVAIAATAVAIFILTIQTTFLSAVAIATLTRLFIYATTCLALPIFRWRDDSPPAGFKTPFGIFVSMISLILIGWLLTKLDFGKEGFPILLAAAAGIIIYAAAATAKHFRNQRRAT